MVINQIWSYESVVWKGINHQFWYSPIKAKDIWPYSLSKPIHYLSSNSHSNMIQFKDNKQCQLAWFSILEHLFLWKVVQSLWEKKWKIYWTDKEWQNHAHGRKLQLNETKKQGGNLHDLRTQNVIQIANNTLCSQNY